MLEKASDHAPEPIEDPGGIAFRTAACCPSGRIDLLRAASALVLDARPEADLGLIESQVSIWAARLSSRLRHAGCLDDPLAAALRLSEMLYDEEGFAVDQVAPHDPANVELDLVLERRLGVPLSLALIQVEVGRRAGLPLRGLCGPGRLFVGLEVPPRPLLFDPKDRGRLVLPESCPALVESGTPGLSLRAEFQRPLTERRWLERLLGHLKRGYLRRSDPFAAIRAQGRLIDLRPGDVSPLQERARLAFQVGRHQEALHDLEKAVSMASDESSGRLVRRQLEQVRRWIAAMS
ncbi:MAG: tetratricopeptide repeat protein [Acidobacteriota bacterium]